MLSGEKNNQLGTKLQLVPLLNQPKPICGWTFIEKSHGFSAYILLVQPNDTF